MEYIYIIAAFLCSWRLTDLVLTDKIFNWLRSLRPNGFNPSRCIFCVSVWAGIISTGVFYYAPWFNLPLAFSQSVLLVQLVLNWQAFKAWQEDFKLPKIVFRPGSNGQVSVDWGIVDQRFGLSILKNYVMAMEQKDSNKSRDN